MSTTTAPVPAAPVPGLASSSTPAAQSTTFSPADVEIATRAADRFIRIFYETYDSDTRLSDLPQFYRKNSSLTWNGKPFQGIEGVKELVENMPITKHEVQSFDCHPIPGRNPPSLMVTVSGNVTHGRGVAGNPPQTTPRNPEGHPRVFSQTFLLLPDSEASAVQPAQPAKYYVSADAMRFVG